jgi:hypothetical protein
MKEKTKPCIVSCSVLRKEIEKLVQKGDIDAELVFVSKYFHVDYAQLEKNLRQVVEKTIERFPGNVILVFGDLCLGMDNEMKKLTAEYGIVKVDAVNCIDCQLGGKGKFLEADPDHNLMFLSAGMTDFFSHVKDEMRKENMDEDALKELFKGLKGIILLDTLGEPEKLKREIQKLDTGLTILETRQLGIENVKSVIQEAIARNKEESESDP